MPDSGQRLGDAARLVPVWLSAAAAAVLLSGAGAAAAVLPAAIAFAFAGIGLRWAISSGAAAASALAAAAALDPARAFPWYCAAVCLSIVLGDRARGVEERGLDELDRLLERCRRSGEPATALLLQVEADATALRNLLRSTRVTDSLVVRGSRSRREVYGLFAGGGPIRGKVETRFVEALDREAAFGWASYPDDGLTLDALLDHARASLLEKPGRGVASAGDTATRVKPTQEPANALEAGRTR